jgi:DME family drug/metabolite transporter
VASYMALVPMFLGYLLFGIGLARVSASTATTITIAEPAVATLLAIVVVGERLTGLGWAGLAVIALVLVLLAFAPGNAATAPRVLRVSRRAARVDVRVDEPALRRGRRS